MQGKNDVLDESVVEAVDKLCQQAVGKSNWWEGHLITAAQSLREKYRFKRSYPSELQKLRPYAYLPLYTPRYLPRLGHALRAADLKLSFLLQMLRAAGEPLRILDLGAGTGILTVAFLVELNKACPTLEKTRVEVVLRDIDTLSLDVAARFLHLSQEAWPSLDVHHKYQQGEICEVAGLGKFDIVLVGHVVCESYQFHRHNNNLSTADASVDAFLEQLLPAIRSQLSSRGVVIILEPLDKDYLSVPLHIRDYVRANSALTFLAPCLGKSLVCPEKIEPYSQPPTCSGATNRITWKPTPSGNHLRFFTEAMLGIRGQTRYFSIRPSCFFPLVLALGKREPVPTGVGMTVRRVGLDTTPGDKQPVCIVGDDGYERVEVFIDPGASADRSLLRGVNTQNRRNMEQFDDYALSALYPKGWPVV